MTKHVWKTAPVEPAIAPNLPIIDPHHHFWGDDDAAGAHFGRFLPEDVTAEITRTGHNIIASIYLECGMGFRTDGPEPLRCVGETETVVALTSNCTAPKLAAGIVAHADLILGDAVAPVLEAQLAAAPGRVKGIRDMLTSDPDMQNWRDIPPGKSRDPQFRAGMRQLERYGLSFDVLCVHPQLDEIAELAGAFPNTQIILNHCGEPMGIGRFADQREVVFADWRRGITALARQPNVSIKLSGLGMAHTGFGWTDAATPPDSDALATAFRPYMLHAIEAFSPQRCMFASNFPVDGLSYAYGTLWNAFKKITEDCSNEERSALFFGTANRIYRLGLQ